MIRLLSIVLLVAVSWYAMMAIHESGHVLHAWLSGGRVATIHFGLFEFSRTELSFNPHPEFVAWGGPIWGSVWPAVIYCLVPSRFARVKQCARYFAGFCLIANGTYIGIGWINHVGDAGDLLRHGAPLGSLILFGIVTIIPGLFLWHQMGPGLGLRRTIPSPPPTPIPR